MGARVYISALGRFLSIDSKEGGTDNNYAYENDPVNSFDLDGNAGFWSGIRKSVQKAARWAWKNREGIAAGIGIAACVVGTAGACLGAAVAAAAVSGAAAGYAKYRQTNSMKKAIGSGIVAGGRDFIVGSVAGKLAGAKYVARYFGRVGTTTRYYQSMRTVFRKAPARQRAYRQVFAGGLAYGYQQYPWKKRGR